MKYIINKYYDFLMAVEDLLSMAIEAVNNHRKRIDNKYWDKYIK